MRHANAYIISLSLCAFFVVRVFACSPSPDSLQFAQQREHMVKTQIESRGVLDKRVLQAMRKVERHRFLPAEYLDYAYRDHPLPIGYGQTISQPYIVALMTEALNLKATDKVLEIGTGSGYQAAVLAEICPRVYSIEIVEELGRQSRALLDTLGYKNIRVKTGDGYQGWPEFAPFDAIIVTCSPTHIPPALEEQLAEEGRMVIPVDEEFYQELVLLVKVHGELKRTNIIPVRFVPMLRKDGTTY